MVENKDFSYQENQAILKGIIVKSMVHQDYTLVTQSFGRENEYRRAVLTILSFFAQTDTPQKVILFTDNQSWFSTYLLNLPVQYVHLSPEKIIQMRGKIDFLHRMKIVEIDEAFQIAQGNLLYADSDTFFTADPSAFMATLSPKKSYMHLKEYTFESLRGWVLPAGKTFVDFLNLIENEKFKLSNGEVRFDTNMCSWNAGVMMLHWEHRHLLKDVFLLTDQFFPKSQNHASEQYAFSLVLQNNTDLRACEEVIYHYWYKIKKSILDEFLPTQLFELQKLDSTAERLLFIRNITKMLPAYLQSHLYIYKDNAIQNFNEDKYKIGLAWAFKAILKGGLKDMIFLKDVLYHTKRKLFK